MRLVISVLAWALAEAVSVLGPTYPPNAVSGGNVVALLRISEGSIVGLDIMQGDEPFVAATKSALSLWRFRDADAGEVLVVVNFRTPRLYGAGSANFKLPAVRTPGGLPGPTSIVEPAYPPNSLGEGNVILHVTVSPTGSVSNLDVIKSLGDLTNPCVAAVRKWQFAATRTAKKRSGLFDIYAICVLRRPVLAKESNR